MRNNKLYLEEMMKFQKSFNRRPSNSSSAILLFRNYLTYLEKCEKKLGKNLEPIQRKDFHNLLADLDLMDKIKSFDNFSKDLTTVQLETFPTGRFYDRYFVYLYILWETFKNEKELRDLSNINPYIFVIKILERSNNIFIYSNQFNIGHITFNNFNKYEGYVLPSLDDKFLDYIDKSFSDIPNQDETNRLWEEFQKM
ncbi:hypothetical protein [Chryseobacterium sp. MFBS3-17]|uniref:hypothetical protein n=1 Tax=Chryseobacterium sp. MFBS3-17 TaxID=2886689 RepID=UPI001D0E94C3|nr:hypothetical protein [Chryseobacterium sp. MFBS3-17]MCC2589768.1 hypothetical protein [Chryseobacterium sp. MFBS3-17]